MRLIVSLFLILSVCSSVYAGKVDHTPYKKYHDELSHCYYKGLPFRGEILTKEKFEDLHSLNWLELREERLKEKDIDMAINGYPSEPETKKMIKNRKEKWGLRKDKKLKDIEPAATPAVIGTREDGQ